MKFAWKHLVIAFLVGGVVGFAGARWSAPYFFHQRWESRQFQDRLLEQFNAKLKLTPEQRTKVAAVLEAKRQKVDALRAEVRPKFEEIRSSAGAEIRSLLSPEQQKRFDVMQAEWERRWKQWHSGAAKS